MTLSRDSLHGYKNNKRGWIAWAIPEYFKKYNRTSVEKCFTFPVNKQSFQVHVLCWTATDACHLIHGICLNHRKTFLAIHAQNTIHRKNFIKEIFTPQLQLLQVRFQCVEVQGHLSQEMKKDLRAQYLCRCLLEGRQPWILFCQWKFQSILSLDSKDRQMSELQFDNFTTPSMFFSWKIRFKNQVTICSDFPSEAMFWIKELEMIDSVDDFKIIEFNSGLYSFPVFLKCWMRELLSLWTRSSRIPVSRKRSVRRNRKPKKRIGFYEEDRSPSRSTTTFEWLALTISLLITLIYFLLLSVMTTFRNSVQDGTKFYCRCQKFHPMISWKVCTNWGYVSLNNSKPYYNCTTWKFTEDIDAQLSSWKPWWREV